MEYKQHYNPEIAKIVDNALKNKKYDDFFKGIIREAVMRKAYEFDMSFQEIEEEVNNISRNVNNIAFTNNDNGNMGTFYPVQKKITINREYYAKKLIQNNQSIEDLSLELFETIVHELQHASQERQDGTSGLTNDTNGYRYGAAADEIHVETMANRLVFSKNSDTSKHYRNDTTGYGDITFVPNIMAASFGVTEKEWLYYANKGRVGVEELLQKVSNFSTEEYNRNKSVYDALEADVSILYNLSYNKNLKSAQERGELTSQTLTNIYQYALWNVNERLSKQSPESINSEIIDSFNYDRNKIDKIMLDMSNAYEYNGYISSSQNSNIVNSADEYLTVIDEKLINLDCALKSKEELQSKNPLMFETINEFILSGKLDENKDYFERKFPEFMQRINDSHITTGDITQDLDFETELIQKEYDEGKVWDNTQYVSFIGNRLWEEISKSKNIRGISWYKGEDGKTYVQGEPKQKFADKIKNLYYRFKNRNLQHLGDGTIAANRTMPFETQTTEFKEIKNTLEYIKVDEKILKPMENMQSNETFKDKEQHSLEDDL